MIFMENGHDRDHILRHERTERIIESLATKMDRLEDELRAFMASQVLMGENLDKQARESREWQQRQRELERRTDQRFAETNDKLNALIAFFEQHPREHRGEKS